MLGSPNRMVFVLLPCLATTTNFLLLPLGRRLGLLYPDTPARFNLGSFDAAIMLSSITNWCGCEHT